MDVIANMARSAVNTVKSWLGIGSPSTVFRQMGQWSGEGFAQGLQRATPDAVTAATDMARAVAATPTQAPTPHRPGADGARRMQDAVTAGVLAGMHRSTLTVEGDGMARLVNRQNRVRARR